MAGRKRVERAEVAERRTKALRLRIEGKSVAHIAQALGYSSTARVSEDITRALAERNRQQGDASDEWRQLEIERLDALYDAVWQVLIREHPYVSGGTVVTIVNDHTGQTAQLMDDGPTLAAVDRLVRIAERRAKLLGLDRPDRLEATVITADTDSALERLRAVLGETSQNQDAARVALAQAAPKSSDGNGHNGNGH